MRYLVYGAIVLLGVFVVLRLMRQKPVTSSMGSALDSIGKTLEDRGIKPMPSAPGNWGFSPVAPTKQPAPLNVAVKRSVTPMIVKNQVTRTTAGVAKAKSAMKGHK